MRFKIRKSYWQQDIKRKESVLAAGKSICITMVMAYLFYRSWVGAAVLVPVGFFHYCMCRQECLERKCQEFQGQFKEALQTLTTALNVGYSLENAMREVLKEMKTLYGKDSMIVRELSYIVRQLEMNITVEQAFREFAARVNMEEVRTFVMVLGVTKRSGGDMISILKNTIEKICMKMEVKQEIQTLVAAKKMEFGIMCVIPVVIIIYMKVSFSEFMSVLYGNAVGMVIMSICLGIYLAAYYLGKTMLEIEV